MSVIVSPSTDQRGEGRNQHPCRNCFLRLLRLLSFRANLHKGFDEKLSALFSDVLPEEVETHCYVTDDCFFVGQ